MPLRIPSVPRAPGRFLTVLLIVAALTLTAPAAAPAADGNSIGRRLDGPQVLKDEGNIYVSARLRLDEKDLKDLEDGLSKEITFYVDLFRVWDNWLDEFVTGRKITRTLKCDPVKKEYLATSLEGSTLVEKRFRGCKSLSEWALTVNSLKLAGREDLDPSYYFVRVTAESRLRTLPPVINFLFFFVKEREFTLKVDSKKFTAGGSE